MAECYAGFLPSQELLFSNLCYSNILGIMDSPGFACRNYVEDNHVLIYINKGTLVCEQNDFVRVLNAGDYILLDKKILHSYFFDEGSSSEIYWMHINGSLANQFIEQIQELKPLPIVDRNTKVFSLLKQSISSFREKRADSFAHTEAILSILCAVLEDAYRQNQKINRSSEELIFREQFDKIIGSIPLEHITLDVLCREMHLSKFYFSHRFKQYYGTSPMSYILWMKLSRSEQFLRYSNLKIATIAKECGFSSPSHFSVAFRRKYGLSPEAYRSKNSQN